MTSQFDKRPTSINCGIFGGLEYDSETKSWNCKSKVFANPGMDDRFPRDRDLNLGPRMPYVIDYEPFKCPLFHKGELFDSGDKTVYYSKTNSWGCRDFNEIRSAVIRPTFRENMGMRKDLPFRCTNGGTLFLYGDHNGDWSWGCEGDKSELIYSPDLSIQTQTTPAPSFQPSFGANPPQSTPAPSFQPSFGANPPQSTPAPSFQPSFGASPDTGANSLPIQPSFSNPSVSPEPPKNNSYLDIKILVIINIVVVGVTLLLVFLLIKNKIK